MLQKAKKSVPFVQRAHCVSQSVGNQLKMAHRNSKNNQKAIHNRELGNIFFKQNQYRQAMESYNHSLCLSEIGSENISLAYANRSVCFFHLKMFDKCLVDIELAIKAGYPKNKMFKLEKRRTEAENAIANGLFDPAAHVPTLSYKPNQKIPVIADAIHIAEDPELEPQFIAKKNIAVGETIYLEPSFVGMVYLGKFESCNICLQSNVNMEPCKKCDLALFCTDEKCQSKKNLHKFECGMDQFWDGDTFLLLVIRSIMAAVELFPNIDELNTFVETALTTKSNTIADFNDAKQKYNSFLRHECNTPQPDRVEIFQKEMMSCGEISTVFDNAKKKIILKKLITLHLSILRQHTMSAKLFDQAYFNQMGIFQRLFKYSCDPNVIFRARNGSVVGIVVRPINKHAEITGSSIFWPVGSEIERKQFIKKKFGDSKCGCPQCIKSSGDLHGSNDYLANHVFYRDILRERQTYNDSQFCSKHQTEIAKAKCVVFLDEFGDTQPCIELSCVKQFYIDLISLLN